MLLFNFLVIMLLQEREELLVGLLVVVRVVKVVELLVEVDSKVKVLVDKTLVEVDSKVKVVELLVKVDSKDKVLVDKILVKVDNKGIVKIHKVVILNRVHKIVSLVKVKEIINKVKVLVREVKIQALLIMRLL